MITFFQKIKAFVIAHKVWGAIILIILALIAHFLFKGNSNTQIRYVMATVSKNTIITSVTGTGQVSSLNQIDIKPKVGGTVTYVAVKNGQHVGAGGLILSLDATDAQKAVRDAKANLESAKLSLAKLQEPADAVSLLQAQNALDQAKNDLAKSYDDGFTSVANVYLNLPNIMSGLNNVLYGTDLSPGGSQWNVSYYNDMASQYETNLGQAIKYSTDAQTVYQTARTEYDANFAAYKATTRSSSTASINSLISQTHDTVQAVSQAVKNANNLIQYYQDQLMQRNLVPVSKSNTHLVNLSTYTSQTNSQLSDLTSAIDSIHNYTVSIPEKEAAFTKLKTGTDQLDIQSSNLSIEQRQNALLDAQQNLANYSVRAPFDGVIGNLIAQKAGSVSTGSAVATLVTNQHIVEISLNEVDVAKVSPGQKATLTFDAIPDLTIAGNVAEVDPIGTVTQGVVNYNVKIVFASEDDGVKTGMSVSASIITLVKTDVLTVPNSAIKNQGGNPYVLMFDTPLPVATDGLAGSPSAVVPRQQNVVIGVSNDSTTEIVSGLKEEDEVVSRTITASITTTVAPSLLGNTSSRGSLGGGGSARTTTTSGN